MLEPQNIFTTSEMEENEKKKIKLFELLSSGEGILMAGAGLTASMYPPWRELIEQMYQAARKIDPKFKKYDKKIGYLNYCDSIKTCIGHVQYYHFIYTCYQTKLDDPYRSYHKTLAGLLAKGNLKAITTTNYDLVLDSALTSFTKQTNSAVYINSSIALAMVFDFLRSLNSKETIKRIFHFHGIYSDEDSIILSRSEYEKYYGFNLENPASSLYESLRECSINEANIPTILNKHGLNWPLHRKILWSFLATRRMIFMGFSLDDPFFIHMLEQVGRDLHTFGYANHFLIARVKDLPDKIKMKRKAEDLKTLYGIETIFFIENEKSTGLEDFIAEMDVFLNPDGNQVTIEQPTDNGQVLNHTQGRTEVNKLLIKISQGRHESNK